MSYLIMLIMFCAIIVIHEYGHFIAAKKSGVFVEEFAIGMGPKLWGKEKEGTLYSIRLFPIGGYCKMKDEDSKSTDIDSFGNATKLKKFIILFAGAFMNFLLAIAIFVGISFFSATATTEIASVEENLPASNAGIMEGDVIYKINGKRVRLFDDITFSLIRNEDKPINVTVKRDGEKLDFTIQPKLQDGRYVIGITSKLETAFIGEKVEGYDKAGFFDSIYNGFWNMIFTMKATIVGVFDLFTAQVELEELTGPIGLAPVINNTYEEASKVGVMSIILTMLNLTALLSANIGVMNLLPLPALDGGRIVFLLIEAIRGKPIPEEKEGMVHFVGFVALMVFGVFIAFKDLRNIFF
ncbi:MAG: RIP metalloprotease RseP [Eubacteriales bacterium]|nr:RIP metalloprotease RseP [Eubacteriales bacterium]